MVDTAKQLCGAIKEVCLNTSKKLAFKPPTELSVFVIKNLLIINVEGIFNKAEMLAARNLHNREKIILARHAVAGIWVKNVADGLAPMLNMKPRTFFLDYRPEYNTAMFVLYYDETLMKETDEQDPTGS